MVFDWYLLFSGFWLLLGFWLFLSQTVFIFHIFSFIWGNMLAFFQPLRTDIPEEGLMTVKKTVSYREGRGGEGQGRLTAVVGNKFHTFNGPRKNEDMSSGTTASSCKARIPTLWGGSRVRSPCEEMVPCETSSGIDLAIYSYTHWINTGVGCCRENISPKFIQI